MISWAETNESGFTLNNTFEELIFLEILKP
jgi:hypothetical protein